MSDEDAAASKIQALQRGREARRAAEEKKREMQEQKEQDDAAKKIQALQRGKEARRQAEEKKKEREEQNQAAAKIQSIQRGRDARRRMDEEKLRKLGPFVRPFLSECEDSAVVELRGGHAALEQYAAYEDFVDALQKQFPARGIERNLVYYSTADKPDVFCNLVSQYKLDQWREHVRTSEQHKRGDLGPVGEWIYGEVKKKKYRILREKVEGKGLQLVFQQEYSGERGETRGELVTPGNSEADVAPQGFKAQWMAKLKNGDEPDGTIWLRLQDDTTMESIYRPAATGEKGAQEKLLCLTATGKWRKEDEAQEDAKPKKKSAILREEKEKKKRQKEIEREVALRGHELNVQGDKLSTFLNMRHLKVIFTGYKPTSAVAAFRNHLIALAARDVGKLVADYTGRSVLRVLQTATGETTEYSGLTGANEFWESLCGQLGHARDLACPVQQVEEDAGNGCGAAAMEWHCLSAGLGRVISKIMYDGNFKAVKHEISITRGSPSQQAGAAA
eukprot:TRINITY_DN2050_c0_g2_i1.p1 TRINITY_DN2050_c0_g2~~TRINITY_DN2050_c0_g2_i1.p1  ORF type:complete len:532 (+),score=215.47 TRINITY_DN2050_c0_g2_i1:86-1597(+)